MSNVLPLRRALLANAIFSTVSGLLMAVQPALVGDWLGLDGGALVLRSLGGGLILFAATLIYIATRPRVATWQALLASAADFLWVVGSLVLLLISPQLFAPGGKALVLAVAGAVFLFGVWQIWAIDRAHRIAATGEYRHCVVVTTNAPADVMWQVVGNMGEIQRYMPELSHSTILDDQPPGVGAVRVCATHAGQQWAEECTAFEPGRSFTVRFRAEAADFPFPVRTMRGGWEVMPCAIGFNVTGTNATGSEVMVWWELTPKHPRLGALMLPLFAWQADRTFPDIIRRMAAAALAQATSSDAPTPAHQSHSVLARLAPRLC